MVEEDLKNNPYMNMSKTTLIETYRRALDTYQNFLIKVSAECGPDAKAEDVRQAVLKHRDRYIYEIDPRLSEAYHKQIKATDLEKYSEERGSARWSR
ncbi:MAG: hypothetical protein H6908_03605 [Hyphomicrobiales bacterium]|nr:hypothetical protein [Hyphomicrobiales bacterium]